MSNLSELQYIAQQQGYYIRIEDKSLIDATPVYAIYRNDGICITRFTTIAAALRWFT